MQNEVSGPVSPQVAIGLSSQSTMVSASFLVLGVDSQNRTMTLSGSTTTGVTRSVDQENGSNIITVQFSETVSFPTAGFSLTFNIENIEDLGWSFAERSAVFHNLTGSTVPAGMVINPVGPGSLTVVFWIATGPAMPLVFPTFRFSIAFTSVVDGSPLNIDDPTVILKPPPPEV